MNFEINKTYYTRGGLKAKIISTTVPGLKPICFITINEYGRILDAHLAFEDGGFFSDRDTSILDLIPGSNSDEVINND